MRRFETILLRFMKKHFSTSFENQSDVDSTYSDANIGTGAKLGTSKLAGKNFIGNFSVLNGNISIGYATTLVDGCILRGDIALGNYCQLTPRVSIFSRNHPTEHSTIYVNRALFDGRMKKYQPQSPIRIGHDVWIGYGAIILKGVTQSAMAQL